MLFEEKPGTVLFAVACAFLAGMWLLLLQQPQLIELPARVMLGGLTLFAVLLRPL
jgi:hypothetical protein